MATLRLTLPPWQNDVAPITFTVGTVGFAFTVTAGVLVELAEHPDKFVTVTAYTPDDLAT